MSSRLTLDMNPPHTRSWSNENCCSSNLADSSTQDNEVKLHLKEDEGENRYRDAHSENHIAELVVTSSSIPKIGSSGQFCFSDSKAKTGEAISVQPQQCPGKHVYRKRPVQCNKERNERCDGSCSTSISSDPQIVDQFSKKFCCTDNIVPCDSDADINSASSALRGLQVTNSTFTPESDDIDIERALGGTQHITLQVQGMTCTGCEKKVFKLLSSLPEVSQVKTSLFLAQAEFHLRSSGTVDPENIATTLQKLSEFTFKRIVHVGEELDLVVEDNIQGYVDCWPSSVINVTILSENRIRISYYPKATGVRELLSDPFFQHARLAPPAPPPFIASCRAHLWKVFYMTLFSAVCTIPALVLAWAQLPKHDILYGAVSLGLASMVQVVVARPFYISAIKTLIFSRMVEMDLLVVLSTTTAYIYSIVAYAYLAAGEPLVTGEFFETSTLLVTLIMVGRTLSSLARQRAVESIAIESLQTKTAIIIDQEDDEEKEIDARLLQYHDIFKVLPEMSIVTDGIVMSGESEVNESLITGEATLVHKRRGNLVVAGSINHSGTLKVQVTRLPCENTIKTIGDMVDEAKSSKPKVQELADRVASYFVPAILGITLVVFVAWVLIGKVVRHQSSATSCIAAMTAAISVLIVSCPCAIGLAVPMVAVIAGGVGARNGLIFKTAETIDTARKVSHVIFDKTGTLTQGKLRVVEEEFIKPPLSYEASMMLGLTTNSKHPVAKAVASHLHGQGIEPFVINSIISVPGKGLKAIWKGYTVKAGNPYWLNVQEAPQVRKVLASGLSVFCATINDNLVAVYGLQDLLRPDAKSTINELQNRGIGISIVSGDTKESVHFLASDLGIPSSNILPCCTPEEKKAYVKSKLLSSPKSIVLFCGDGTNDAPSLAQASIGVHMTEGTEIAASAADAVIMRPSLGGILMLMDLSKAFHRRIVFNFAWSFVYNLFAVLLAAGVFPRAGILPQYAGLGEAVSVVPVIAIAMGLKWKKF